MTQKLNILMPSYNRGAYIRTAIESVLMQKTNFAYTLIITDDCSTDDTAQIVAEYTSRYPDKVVFLPSQKNNRLLANILKAYRYMDCEYFCCLDADDYWTDDTFLQKAIDFLDTNPEYSIYASNTSVKYSDEYSETPTYESKYYDSTLDDVLHNRETLGHTSASIFRNKYFTPEILDFMETKIGNPYVEHSFREDDFRNRVHLTIGRARFVNEVVSVYRVTDAGIFQGSTKLKKLNLKSQAYLDMYEFFGFKNIEWVQLAADKISTLYTTVLTGDFNNITKFSAVDVSRTIEIMDRIRQYSPEIYDNCLKNLLESRQVTPRRELGLLYKVYLWLYKFTSRKLRKKNAI